MKLAGEQNGVGGGRRQQHIHNPRGGAEQAAALFPLPRGRSAPPALDLQPFLHPAVAAQLRRAAREPLRLPAPRRRVSRLTRITSY